MPVLHILRHAKSSWGDPGMRDFDRPLANRGLKACPLMGAFMRDSGITPDMILCSTSHRTRATLGLILPYLAGTATILLEDFLYRAQNEEEVVERLQDLPAHADSVMLIGHNPILQDLALTLVSRNSKTGDYPRLAEKFPTAALASISLPKTAWSQLAPDTGELIRFTAPADLQTV